MTQPEQLPFHRRFNIEVDLRQAEGAFVNRVCNIVDGFLTDRGKVTKEEEARVLWTVALSLGKRHLRTAGWEYYTQSDFLTTLRALETMHTALPTKKLKDHFSVLVRWVLSESETDLGIQWIEKEGVFIKSGAKFLDDALVNDTLEWLSDKKWTNVHRCFIEGLKHLSESVNNPGRLSDTVEDMYKATESVAKAVTGIDRDLSGNREQFVAKLGLEKHFVEILKEYIAYANTLARHGNKPGAQEDTPKPAEVEAFVYLTGLLIRLSIQQTSGTTPAEKP